MFELEQYTIGIPLPPDAGNRLNELILAIAAKEPGLGITKKLLQQFNIKNKFHITLGVLNKGDLASTRDLFKSIIQYLQENRESYAALKANFNGTGVITGIGFNGNTISDSEVVWASVASEEVFAIRAQIQNILVQMKHQMAQPEIAAISDDEFVKKVFSYTDPHITLFMKKGDIHGIPKPMKTAYNEFAKSLELLGFNSTPISFSFQTVFLYGLNSEVIAAFGGAPYTGEPGIKFKEILNIILAKEKKPAPYNFAKLFQHPVYKAQAVAIKTALLKKGREGLIELGCDENTINDILQLVSVQP